MTKPPLGLRPKFIWNINVKINRIKEIEEAIKRYHDADFPVPYAWEEELRKLKEEMDNGNGRTSNDGAIRTTTGSESNGWRTNRPSGATFYDGGANGWF